MDTVRFIERSTQRELKAPYTHSGPSAYASPWKILIWIAEPDAADWLIRQSRRSIMLTKQVRTGEVFQKRKKGGGFSYNIPIRDIVARQGKIITRTSRHDDEIKKRRGKGWYDCFPVHPLEMHLFDLFYLDNKLIFDFILYFKNTSISICVIRLYRIEYYKLLRISRFDDGIARLRESQ